MSPRPISLLLAFLLAIGAPPTSAIAADSTAGKPRTITWEELVPPGWDPVKDINGGDVSSIREGGAQEQALMKRMREVWDNAPTRPELADQRLRLPGFVVPVESVAGLVREFLLVPYFGACIHSPPPPANQIVLVKLSKPADLRTMEAVWAQGRLSLERAAGPMGNSGYTLEAADTEPYSKD